MTVYIVMGSWEYEGSDLIEVYANRANAEARQVAEIARGGYDEVIIEERVPR
jgi:hypothetical protein